MLVDTTWQACANPNSIFYFLEVNGRMFSGGVHDELYGQYAPGIHEWRDSQWQDIPGMPFTGQVQVNDVEYWNGQYYFGGVFQTMGSRKVVAFDGVDQWSPLGGGVGGNFVRKVCGYGDSLYVGGYMLPGPDVASQHLQIWDGVQWLPFFDEVNVVGQTKDIEVHEGALYISGAFTFGSDTTMYGLIRYADNQICALGGYMSQGGSQIAFLHDRVYMALPPSGNQLFYECIGYLDLDTVVPDTCVLVTPNGIQETIVDADLRVYPNPAWEWARVSVPDGLSGQAWEVCDVLGRRMETGVAHSLEIELDLTGWPTGTYLLKFIGSGTRTARFVQLGL